MGTAGRMFQGNISSWVSYFHVEQLPFDQWVSTLTCIRITSELSKTDRGPMPSYSQCFQKSHLYFAFLKAPMWFGGSRSQDHRGILSPLQDVRSQEVACLIWVVNWEEVWPCSSLASLHPRGGVCSGLLPTGFMSSKGDRLILIRLSPASAN